MHYVNLNGKLFEADGPLLHPDNRSFRYGEGLFETIRLHNGTMPLWPLHWERLQASLPKVFFTLPPHTGAPQLYEQVLQLAAKNRCMQSARVRITFFNGNGGLWDEVPATCSYLLQCWPVAEPPSQLNVNGLDTGIYTGGAKSCDAFANIKSNNYLLYAVAARSARLQHWNDALILNQHGRICDTTIANLFLVRQGVLYTPALAEGCVAGVMRRHLLQHLPVLGYRVEETICTVEQVQEADELLLTNAFYGIRWVKSLGNRRFGATMATALYKDIVAPLFKP